MKKTISIVSTVLLFCIFCFGTYTVIDANHTDKKPNQPNNQTDIIAQTQPAFEYTPLSISDGKLAYYDTKPSGLLKEKHILEKPKYEINEFGKVKSITVRLNKNNIKWGIDTEENINNETFVARNLTGQTFKYLNSNCDIIYITDYAYNNAFEPCKKIITDYIKETGKDVLYRVNLEYDSKSRGDKSIPKWINIQACTTIDDGETFDFSFFIYNYDQKRIADKNTDK